jgi:hypothetical protein
MAAAAWLPADAATRTALRSLWRLLPCTASGGPRTGERGAGELEGEGHAADIVVPWVMRILAAPHPDLQLLCTAAPSQKLPKNSLGSLHGTSNRSGLAGGHCISRRSWPSEGKESTRWRQGAVLDVAGCSTARGTAG